MHVHVHTHVVCTVVHWFVCKCFHTYIACSTCVCTFVLCTAAVVCLFCYVNLLPTVMALFMDMNIVRAEGGGEEAGKHLKFFFNFPFFLLHAFCM